MLIQLTDVRRFTVSEEPLMNVTPDAGVTGHRHMSLTKSRSSSIEVSLPFSLPAPGFEPGTLRSKDKYGGPSLDPRNFDPSVL